MANVNTPPSTHKRVLYGKEARDALLTGSRQLARAVGATLGPRGRNVVLMPLERPATVTKDGVTVADEFELSDPCENAAVKLLRSAASKTADGAGDGTTTATVLADAILVQGMRAVGEGANPIYLKRGIDAATEWVQKRLEEWAKPVENYQEVVAIATISANGDGVMGQMIADAIQKVGKSGAVTVEEGSGMGNELRVVDGMQFGQGYMSPYFATDPESMECRFDRALVLLYDGTLDSVDGMVTAMKMSKEKDLALLVIANEYTADIMQLLVVNRMRGKVRVCAIKGPGYGKRRTEQLEDVAALAGAAVISPEVGHDLRKLKFEQLGIVASVVVDRNTTLMRHAGGGKEAIDQRVKQLEAMLVATGPSMSDYDREKLNERIARLTSGVAVVAVGGATAMETKERCYRIEDAIHATRAAIEGGTLTGGGFPLLVAGRLLKEMVRKEKPDWLPTHEHSQGAMILATALAVPAKLIIENSGEDPEKILARIGDLRKVPFTGWDSSVGKICDLREAGILDPLKVVREALVNAVSAATMMLTTEVMIVEVGEIFGADQLR